MNYRKLFFLIFLIVSVSFFAYSQEIITAERYLEMVSEKYANMRDYEAKIAIQSNGSNMTGTVSYLVPAFLRIDFTAPAEQVIVFNGDQLTLYLPDYRAVLTQAVTSGRSSASGQGLRLLRRNYTPSYVTGPAPVALEGTGESVVKLRLTRRSGAESFREIILSINPDSKLIRRIDGTTLAGALVRFDFSSIKINQGIPEQRFIYDSPASANMYNNFLFRDTE
jgi:outer membrane lipoprotein-sorting protein